ncbi:MAG: single-stranded-DNA-specific exonuclease [Thermoplasmata archaeon]|jgi:RecJ-like exonuclease|nr:single-stranded-DNA-specific exonuclease [Thermoplasmata archaeon]
MDRFQEAAARAAALVRSRPAGTRWLLACDTDADGLGAAAVAAQALLAVGQRFTIRASRDKTAAAYAALWEPGCDAVMLLDKGTSHLADLAADPARAGRPVLVVDHHNLVGEPPTDPMVVLLNPRAAGLDGSRDASAATTAAALALALAGDKALAWAPAALAGAIGDWQHTPSWQGWNLELLERARAAGHVVAVPQSHLVGADLAEAIAHSRIGIPGLDQPAAARAWLEAQRIDPGLEVEDLDREAQNRLVSGLALRLMAAGQHHLVPALVVPTDHGARLGVSLRHAFRIVDACGREGQAATGIAYLMGDAAARRDAAACFAAYKQKLVAGLRVLRDQGTKRLRAVQVAWTERADYTGMVAGIGMTHIVRQELPLAVLAQRPDGLVQASTRALEGHVRRGLDLGRACQAAARAVGREGGGHPVAAGAVVPAPDVDAFLAALDDALVAQGFLEAA